MQLDRPAIIMNPAQSVFKVTFEALSLRVRAIFAEKTVTDLLQPSSEEGEAGKVEIPAFFTAKALIWNVECSLN